MLADRPLPSPVRTLCWSEGSVQMDEPQGLVKAYTEAGLVPSADSLRRMSVRNYCQQCARREGHLGLYLSVRISAKSSEEHTATLLRINRGIHDNRVTWQNSNWYALLSSQVVDD